MINEIEEQGSDLEDILSLDSENGDVFPLEFTDQFRHEEGGGYFFGAEDEIPNLAMDVLEVGDNQLPDSERHKIEELYRKEMGKFPLLKITDIPADTKSLALIVDDPDAPGGTWDHLLLANIDVKSDTQTISETTFATAIFGKNSRGKLDR